MKEKMIEWSKTDYVPRSAWMPEVAGEKVFQERSKYFGAPALRRQESWPQISGHPAPFVLQLDVSHLPFQYRKMLGGDGLIQFFYHAAPEGKEISQNLGLVRRVHPTKQDWQYISQPEIEGECVGRVVGRDVRFIYGWHECVDLPEPNSQEFPDPIQEMSRDGMLSYRGDKLGGWPCIDFESRRPIDRFGQEMMAFFQVDMARDLRKYRSTLPCHAPSLLNDFDIGYLFVSASDSDELAFAAFRKSGLCR